MYHRNRYGLKTVILCLSVATAATTHCSFRVLLLLSTGEKKTTGNELVDKSTRGKIFWNIPCSVEHLLALALSEHY